MHAACCGIRVIERAHMMKDSPLLLVLEDVGQVLEQACLARIEVFRKLALALRDHLRAHDLGDIVNHQVDSRVR